MNASLRSAILRGSVALPLIFLGPILTTIGFKAIEDTYIPLILGILISALALFLGVTALIKLLKSLFDKQ